MRKFRSVYSSVKDIDKVCVPSYGNGTDQDEGFRGGGNVCQCSVNVTLNSVKYFPTVYLCIKAMTLHWDWIFPRTNRAVVAALDGRGQGLRAIWRFQIRRKPS